MQGYIFVENENSSRLKYQPRYFILFPFCGLRWFLEEPKEKNIAKLLLSAQEGGWVFGGNVRVNYVDEEDPIDYNFAIDSKIYPFIIELVCGQNFHKIRLGCEDPVIRHQWMEQILRSLHIQHYLYSCVECEAIPSKSIFCAVLPDQSSLILENLSLTIPTLGSLVMMCKLNESRGTILHAIHLENAQISDHHIPLISSLLSFSPFLQSLSLANNYITDDGILQFSNSLTLCTSLILLDLSSNFISDNGIIGLETPLKSLTKLSHLDISRNRLTNICCKSLALSIAGYGSVLTSLNISYNNIGDDAAALAILILSQDSCIIENLDLSYCGITSTGITQLAYSLVNCSTLHNLSLQGNFGSEKSLILLFDAMTFHQKKFGISLPLVQNNNLSTNKLKSYNYQQKSALCIHIGGLMIENEPIMIESKVMRMAIAYSSQYSSFSHAILRRRISSYIQSESQTQTQSQSQFQFQSQIQNKQQQNENKKLLLTNQMTNTSSTVSITSIICLKIQLSHHMESIYELMDELARILGADSRQFLILSTSEMDETDCSFIIFTLLEASNRAQEAFSKQLFYLNINNINNNNNNNTIHNNTNSIKKGTIEKNILKQVALPTADEILQNIIDLSKISSPLFRKIGIRTIYIRRRTQKGEFGLPFHCHIRGSGYGGQGVLGEFIPPLFPMASVLERMIDINNNNNGNIGNNGNIYDDYDDDIDEVKTIDNSALELYSNIIDESRDRVESAVWYDEDDEMEGEWKETESEKERFVDNEPNFEFSNLTTLEEVTGNIDSKLIHAIRVLQREGKIPLDAGVFWQQAFNIDQDGEKLIEIMDDALDEDGLFHYVSIRKQLCEAMLRRDVDAMESYITHIKSNNIPGSTALILGEQLLSEVIGVIRDGNNLDSMAEGPQDVGIVENFLMACAKIGYSGRETLVAIELREYLVRWALQDNPEYTNELPGIKQRSLITNIMISRDLPLLRTTLENPDSSTLLSKTQRQSAQKLLEDASTIQLKLKNAIQSGELEEIENCIAEAAYLNIVDDTVSQAVDALVDYAGSAKPLLSNIIRSLRNGNKDEFDASLLEAHRVGWDHSYIHKISPMIYEERNRIVQEEMIKQKLFKMSSDIKSGENIKAIEIMQLIRNIKLFKLDQNSAIQPHIQLLEKHMRRVAGLASIEEEILRLIDERDLVKLTEVLSGRGTGRLVMSAPSAEIMKEWMEKLEVACNLGIDKNGIQHQIEKSGYLEKAARGKEGVLRNWRQRYFVLEGLSISYFTKLGGEKKGCVRVGGGAVREISDDVGGRNFCFELQEGRDLSNIDPELLIEARKQVKLMQKDELEELLVDAVNLQSEEQCSSILERANKFDINLDSDLVTQAKAILLRMQHRALKLELREACRVIPRGQLQELIRSAKRIRLDPSFPYFRIGQLLMEKPESELSILRARGCLSVFDESAFFRSVANIQRFDVKRLGNKEKTVLVAVFLQYSGMMMYNGILLDGNLPQNTVKTLQQSLEGCLQYFVETEPMQLARNIITRVLKNEDVSMIQTPPNLPRDSKPLRRAQSHFDTTTITGENLKSVSQFVLEKFPNIRPHDANARKSFLGRRKSTNTDTNTLLSYNVDLLQKSILNLSKNEDEIACELFKALLIVMGDKPFQGNIGRNFRSISDEYGIANELVKVGINSIMLRDELYIQLFKQLNKNNKLSSRLRGWSLLSIYLHCFPPSSIFLPYVRAFISQAQLDITSSINLSSSSTTTTTMVQNSSNQRRGRQTTILQKTSDMDSIETLITPNDSISRVINYTSKVLKWNEHEALIRDGFSSDISMVDTALVIDIIKRTPIQIEIALLTGSVYNISVSFGDIDSLFSLLSILLQKIVGLSNIQNYNTKTGNNSINDNKEKFLRNDVIIKIFRGFWFYEYDTMDGSYDTQLMPVQPDESSILQWQYDFLWDILQNNSNRVRRLILRRRLFLLSEEFVNQLDLFKDMTAERDVIGTKRLWTHWLHDKSQDLPIDHCRIDLIFAEESRYVNSQLYALSSEALLYLTAIQLLLSLSDELVNVDNVKWGLEHSSLMKNSDPSIRPSLNSKYYFVDSIQKNPTKRLSINSVDSSLVDRRLSLERRGSGLGNLLKGGKRRSSIESDDIDINTTQDDSNHSNHSNNGNNSNNNNINWSNDTISIEDLASQNPEILEDRLFSLGISLPSEMISNLIKMINEFQIMAKHLNISLISQRFRYMLKSAYLSYVMAWPLAGGHFFEGYLDLDDKLEKVLICLSGNGLHLLTLDDWLLIFHAPIFDIQSCEITSASTYKSVSTESQLLRIVVNEKILPIITTSANDIQTLFEAFSLEILSRGSFPHGLEGGNDILDVGESFQSSFDSKVIMQRFLRNYPMLPTPPSPSSLERASIYFDPPKSRRAILAEERAEEERIELEQARLAAESHAAKNLAHLEHGKQTLQKFMTEDDDDDDELDGNGNNNTDKKSKKTRRRTGVSTMKESSENIRNNMITSAVCGISSRPPLISINVPPPPVRGVGMRLDSMVNGEGSNKPAKIGLSTRNINIPNVPITYYRPKFITPKNVIFPIPIEWLRLKIDVSYYSEYENLLDFDELSSYDAPFTDSIFYGSHFMTNNPETIITDNFTRSRQASLVLYASPSPSPPPRQSSSNIHGATSPALSQTSEPESENEQEYIHKQEGYFSKNEDEDED